MVLAITTKENVKAALHNSASTANDAFIDSCIAAVSQSAEDFMGRTIGVGRVVETRQVRPYVKLLSLKAWPITQFTGIIWSEDDDFSANEVIDRTDYVVRANLGQIFWKPTSSIFLTGGFVQITYNGGMAADQPAFQAAFPDIELAAREEVVNILNRRGQPGGVSTVLQTSGTHYTKELTELAFMKRALGRHMRVRLQ